MLEIDLLSDNSERINYNLPGMPVFINKIWLAIDYDLAVECHWHDDVEFFLVTLGELNYNINGECIKLKRGEGLFINSRQLHYGFSYGKNECECICVIMHPMLLCLNEYMERNFIDPVIKNNRFSYAVLSQDITWTAQIFNNIFDIYEAYAQKEKSSTLTIQSLFHSTWALLYENMPIQNYKSENYCDYNLCSMKEMVNFIHKNYNKKISLSEIAASGKVCQSRCSAIFKRYLHESPIAYLTSHRLRKSIELLESTSVPITEIAVSAGFFGVSYFAETFRKHYGCSPSEYRIKFNNKNSISI